MEDLECVWLAGCSGKDGCCGVVSGGRGMMS